MNSSKGKASGAAAAGGAVGNVKNSAKDDLPKKSLPELLETLDRLKKLLSSKSIKNLPDKGAKIPGTILEVEELIKKKQKVDPGSGPGTSSLQDGQQHYVDFSEWANAREKSKPISYLYTPICKTTQEIIDRGHDGHFEGLTKKSSAQIDENGVEIMVVEGDVQDEVVVGPKPKWDESLMPPIKESKSKEIGIKESIQLIKDNINLIKESSSSSSNSEEKNFSIHQSSTRRVNFDVDDEMDLEIDFDNSLLEDIKEEDQISDNEVVDPDMDTCPNSLLDRVKQMDLDLA